MKITPKRQKRSWPLRNMFLVPIILILLLQAAINAGLLFRSLILPEVTKSSEIILSQRTLTRGQDFENQLNRSATELQTAELDMRQKIEMVLQETGFSSDQIVRNPALSNQILQSISDTIVTLAKKNDISSAFIILDASSETFAQDYSYPSLRINATGRAVNEKTLTLACGSIFSLKQMVSLDMAWAPYCTLSETNSQNSFFYRPLTAARLGGPANSSYYGYWSSYKATAEKEAGIAYTLPLFTADSLPIGVIGFEISESLMQELLPAGDLWSSDSGIYLLSLSNNDDFVPVAAVGSNVSFNTFNGNSLSINTEDNVSTTTIAGVACTGSVTPLNIPSSISSYYGQRWALAAFVPAKDLASFSNQFQMISIVSSLVVIVLGLIIVWIVSNEILHPLQNVMRDVKHLQPDGTVKIQKSGIREIDTLTEAIEEMSLNVSAFASKVSKIMDLARVPVGVYEYQNDDGVLCSSGLFRILDWDDSPSANFLIQKSDFENKMAALSAFRCEDDKTLFHLNNKFPRKWIRIIETTMDGNRLGTVTDVTREIENQQRIEYERDYDALTGIFNRRAFLLRAQTLLSRSDALKTACIIMCDLDNLKYVNDTYGHESGDAYIRCMAQILTNLAPQHSLVARRSGDEFVIFLYGLSSKQVGRQMIESLWAQLDQASITLPDGRKYPLRCSGGYAWYNNNIMSLAELTHYADFAMYSIKHSKKGSVTEFSKSEYIQNSYLINGQEALDLILEEARFRFALQPVFDLRTERVFGHEYLLRPIDSPFATPTDVLRMARSQSKLPQLEKVLWYKSMELYVKMREEGIVTEKDHAFFNCIGSMVFDPADQVEFNARFAPYIQNIIIEITEGDRLESLSSLKQRTLVKLDSSSMIALDDYGAGFNGQYNLLSLRPHIIKVDISIIQNIQNDIRKQTLLADAVSFAHTHGILVVAEGVETRAEMETVVDLNVDFLQGFYVGYPSYAIEPISEMVLSEIHTAIQKKNKNAI